MYLVPTQTQWIGYRFLAGDLEPFDNDTLRQSREPSVLFGPGQFHRARAMLGAVGSRRLGVQDGLELAGVQMPPLTYRLMVAQRTRRAAFRARPFQTCRVLQKHMHLAFGQLQINSLDTPRSADTKNGGVEIARGRVLHSPIIGPPPLKCRMSH